MVALKFPKVWITRHSPASQRGRADEMSRLKQRQSAMLDSLVRLPVTCNLLAYSASSRIMTKRKAAGNVRSRDLRFQFEIEREDDGRWIAEIPEVPGAMAYGATEEEAKAKAYALALYAVADDVERSNDIPDSISILRVPA
jgi:predicted RNase H-like HicB family nuclease